MKECDLVMKGGISSGIVYPKAVGILSKDYVFKNIGGASAGAIAAAFTAAAEYQRQNSNSKKGFKLLNKDLPEQIGNDLLSLFQPHEKHSKVFKILVDYISRDKPNKFWFITKNIFHLRKFYRLPETLLKTNFGLCSGLTNNHQSTKGLTDWLNYWLEKTAGRLNHGKLPDRPLTFGDLKAQGIKLKVITTNVSTQQSTPLPFLISCHAKLKDLKNLLPSNLVKYLVNQHNSTSNQTIFNDDYLVRIPKGDEMPVLMAVRMSLSFPVLLAAFPIYQVDRSRRLLDDDDYKVPRLCWYSDGGITSNFPIHLFDNMFPSRPTFGISLDKYHEHRQESDEDNKMSVPGKNRVYLPTNANQGKTIPINTIKSFSSFLGSIFSLS
ncbi:MAG: patatin-like phospholipase family protein [Xanthomonadales bacterium]|nr:patatin-like phospholipase family protein [Xanthomonadales bacterium]